MNFKRIFAALLAAVMIFLFVVPVSAAEVSEVYSDLSSAMLNGKKFDPNDYPKNTADTNVYLLTVDERGYNEKNMEDYGFYLYLYNPSGLPLDAFSAYNRVQMATAWDESSQLPIQEDYSKFVLDFVSVSSESGFEYVFYKFKVGIEYNKTSTIDDYLMPLSRFYDISGIEIHSTALSKVVETKVGMRYAFYGSESARNKTCKASELATIDLDVHHTYFRTESSKNGVNHQNQLNAVYFNVPADYWLSYDFLYAVQAYWEEYRTTPMIVSENADLIAHLTTWRGRGNGEGYNSSNPVSLYDDFAIQSTGPVTHFLYDWIYNVDISENVSTKVDFKERSKAISWAFFSDDIELRKSDVSTETVMQQWESNKAEFRDQMITTDDVNEFFPNRFAGPQTHTILFDETFTMESYGSNHNWLDRLWNYNIFNGGSGTNLKDDYSGILAIEEVSSAHLLLRSEELAKRYFVNPADAENFKAVVDQGKKDGMKTIVFRFAVTDYYAEEINAELNGVKLQDTTYRAEQTVFLDFDIISLTFQKEQEHYVIPVASSPSDFIGGINAPQVGNDGTLGNAVDAVKDVFSGFGLGSRLLRLSGIMLGCAFLILIVSIIVGAVRRSNPVVIQFHETSERSKSKRKGGKKR